ncbi:MAG: twin-arginine translocation signal domain-containing protein [Delftia acidovorans]|uniref:Twin-arginine translocation signal domain-containing protein n=1 Tax=Delftia acidovorans TaxID=80866 RepID=A0A7T2W058_DELAC|nr:MULTISPECIES: twin-arginine translocation signal domain-containing protein [Delftia]MBL8354959.1 twin-arginine translocation signal domain-containing protein [Delftia acidovorans]QPS08848.1 twin-arginine translocation signal domain-containing protein [Delftia acidovorans]
MTHVSIDTKRREFLGTSAIAISAAALGVTTMAGPSTAGRTKNGPGACPASRSFR